MEHFRHHFFLSKSLYIYKKKIIFFSSFRGSVRGLGSRYACSAGAISTPALKSDNKHFVNVIWDAFIILMESYKVIKAHTGTNLPI